MKDQVVFRLLIIYSILFQNAAENNARHTRFRSGAVEASSVSERRARFWSGSPHGDGVGTLVAAELDGVGGSGPAPAPSAPPNE